jgi:hypothetical protein
MLLMLFLQFLSPQGLWLLPLCGGTALAIAWQAAASYRQPRHPG